MNKEVKECKCSAKQVEPQVENECCCNKNCCNKKLDSENYGIYMDVKYSCRYEEDYDVWGDF